MTPEQDKQIDEYGERWLKIGYSQEPADRPRAERAIRALYKQEGMAEPTIHWADSPDQAVREIRAAGLTPDWFFGPHTAYWLAFFEYARNVLGLVKETEEALVLIELAQACGWSSQHDKDVWLVERPKIQLNPVGDLHCTTGPAVEYPGGVVDYLFEGVPVPEQWILNPGQVDMAGVIRERNASVRAAGIKLFGWGRILQVFPERQILDADPRPHMGTLIQVDLPDAPASRLLLIKCPTGRDDARMVPPTIRTALEAQAWITRSTQEEVLARVCRT